VIFAHLVEGYFHTPEASSMATATQILNQIDVNYARMDQIAQLQLVSMPVYKQSELQKEVNRLWQAQKYWVGEYKKVTGKTLPLAGVEVGPVDYKSDAEAAREKADAEAQAAAKKAHDDNVSKLKEAISETHREYQRIRTLLQDQYDISTTMGNALFSHWVRMGGGLSATHPLIFKKQVEDRAWPKLMEAEKYFNQGKYEKAWQKVTAAAKTVKWGFDCLNWWLARLEVGAARAEAGIKISAALAAVIVAAPAVVVVGPAAAGVPATAEIGVGATMLLAGTGEAAQQGTILILNKISGGQSVTLEDLKTAGLEVAVAAGSAGFGKVVANGVGKSIATRIFGPDATKAQIDEVAARVEAYVVANAGSISKQLLKLDKNPDWNWWYTIVMPAFGSGASEMVKEKDVTHPAVGNRPLATPK
jgi:hypothetical protein